jgi:hypothetical protein
MMEDEIFVLVAKGMDIGGRFQNFSGGITMGRGCSWKVGARELDVTTGNANDPPKFGKKSTFLTKDLSWGNIGILGNRSCLFIPEILHHRREVLVVLDAGGGFNIQKEDIG